MRFTFAYPHNGFLWYEFHESIVGMMMAEMLGKKPDDCLLGSMSEAGGCHVPFNRNNIARWYMKDTTDEFLLMVDTDVKFKRDLLVKLANEITTMASKFPYWDRRDHPHIVSGRVNIGNGLPVFFKRIRPGDYKQDPRPFNGLKHFERVGSGIIAISRFCIETLYKEANTTHIFTHAIEEGKLSSDDFSFCLLAEQHGFLPYGAWNVIGEHTKVQTIRPQYQESLEIYEKFKQEHPEQMPDWSKDEFYTPGWGAKGKDNGNKQLSEVPSAPEGNDGTSGTIDGSSSTAQRNS